MGLLYEILIAVLAVAGLFLIVFAAIGGFLIPVERTSDSEVVFTLQAEGDACGLDLQLRRLMILRKLFNRRPAIHIIDKGMKEEARVKVLGYIEGKTFISLKSG